MNDPLSCRIVFLAEHQQYVDELALCLEQVWSEYYGPGGVDAKADVKSWLHISELPIVVIAQDASDTLLGAVALKTRSSLENTELSPWLSALLVKPEYRKRGVGEKLVDAIEQLARDLAYPHLYTITQTVNAMIIRRGWKSLGMHATYHGPTEVFCLDL